ncbi:alpha-1,2-mannosyltransferase [Jatrophihabitans endophyticus]|uniref:Alpha-1,2-mannosyltransferase n=1 Tax=Jatrophihabitans endophyticus TaxID=1206085 RepID=A0A1M5TYL1_9ACTN|nr:glycosyltransferase 87 family protein [Jatrophihabitans endophyticus]SHH55768.1 alpha-1,2-mannosyltransferase [Jatrophihabitans endophyticus]
MTAVAAFALSALAAVLVKLTLAPSPFGDLRIYQLEGAAVRHGADLYGPLPGVHGLATYPPFAGIVFVATTPLPFAALTVLNLLATLATLAWVCIAAGRLGGLDRGRAVTFGLLVAAAGVWCEPVAMTLQYGQLNLYLLALVLWDVTRPPGSRLPGVGIGLAAAVKVTPGVFVVYLLLTRRFATAARAAVTFGATVAVSLLVDARATVAFWTDHLFDVERVGRLENAVNQSVRGWLVRVDHTRDTPPPALLLVVAVAVVGLVAATRAHDRFGDRWGVPACGVTGLLCSPVAWSHHWVWCLPVLVLLAIERVWWLVVAGVATFWSFAVWAVPHRDGAELHLSAGQVLVSGWYVVFGIAFLALTLVRTRRRVPRTAARAVG